MAVLKILVVDDEPGIRSGVARIMRNFSVDYPFMDEHIDFLILEAETGEKGIEIIEAEMPDIILLDNKLPGIQGIEVLEYVKKRNYNIIVVMITSYASLDLAVKATRDGAHDFIPKPFTPQELRSSVENITKRIFLKRMTRQMGDEGKHIRFQFLSVLSHELKAPINAVEGYLAMLKGHQLGEQISDYEQIVDRSIERINGMRSLILDMLDLTRIETGDKKRSIKVCDLKKIAQNAIDTMQPLAIQKDITITLEAEEKFPMFADCTELEIIFNNLISNAVKYNRDKGSVWCSLVREKENIIISVEDTGIGMQEEETPIIFDDFVRIKNESTRKISGSGLGLSIVKKIVTQYDGKINVSSEPGKGTRFTVELPVQNQIEKKTNQ
ncbi:MAG: hybrid sensor histidine kinase/response regulator [Bacteroidia bacterium]|nr:hybrid sensor histidine kinase/response regulator [Bacteroidia bacterium]